MCFSACFMWTKQKKWICLSCTPFVYRQVEQCSFDLHAVCVGARTAWDDLYVCRFLFQRCFHRPLWLSVTWHCNQCESCLLLYFCCTHNYDVLHSVGPKMFCMFFCLWLFTNLANGNAKFLKKLTFIEKQSALSAGGGFEAYWNWLILQNYDWNTFVKLN